jgi:hypothetical protein
MSTHRIHMKKGRKGFFPGIIEKSFLDGFVK